MKILRIVTGVVAMAVVLVPRPTSAASSPAFACRFTEPFETLAIGANGAWFDSPDEPSTPIRNLVVRTTSGAVRITGRTANGSAIDLRITHEPGNDGMSDYTTGWNGLLNGNYGACDRHSDGARVAEVVGVADDDVLNVRAAPNARAAIVTTGRNGSTMFVRPGRSGAWRAVSAPRYPSSGSGLVTVKTGWANGTFLHIR